MIQAEYIYTVLGLVAATITLVPLGHLKENI